MKNLGFIRQARHVGLLLTTVPGCLYPPLPMLTFWRQSWLSCLVGTSWVFCPTLDPLSLPQVLGIHVNKWRLDRKLGIYVLVLYAVFLCFSIMIEFNVFTFVNLPMCREDD